MRQCSVCGKLLFSGYFVPTTSEYFCSDKCFDGKYSLAERKDFESEDDYDDAGNGSYFSEWDPTNDEPEDYIEHLPEALLSIFSRKQIIEAISRTLRSVGDTPIDVREFIIRTTNNLSEK